jgi:hypothetical protein
MVVADGQELLLPFGEPLIARVGQALRTVPVPTRVVRDSAMVALRAPIEMATQGGGAATRESAEHAPMLPGEPGPVRLDEAIDVLSDDVGHLEGWPGLRFCRRCDRRAVSGPDRGIASNGFETACRWRRERWRYGTVCSSFTWPSRSWMVWRPMEMLRESIDRLQVVLNRGLLVSTPPEFFQHHASEMGHR